MAEPFKELVPVGYYIRFPGCEDGIHFRRLAFDPWRLRLHVNGPEGWVSFSAQDDFKLEVLDLSVPLQLRINSPNDGWICTEMPEFLNLLLLDHLSF